MCNQITTSTTNLPSTATTTTSTSTKTTSTITITYKTVILDKSKVTSDPSGTISSSSCSSVIQKLPEKSSENSSEWWISDAELELIQLSKEPCTIFNPIET